MNRNKEHRPNGAASEGDRPIGGAAFGGASVFCVSAHSFFLYYKYLWISLIYSCIASPLKTNKNEVNFADILGSIWFGPIYVG